MRLTNAMHDAVKNSPVGQMIDRLIREEVARGGDTSTTFDGSVIQALWAAFMSEYNLDVSRETYGQSEIKQEIKNANG